jgi:hypothetical protein
MVLTEFTRKKLCQNSAKNTPKCIKLKIKNRSQSIKNAGWVKQFRPCKIRYSPPDNQRLYHKSEGTEKVAIYQERPFSI